MSRRRRTAGQGPCLFSGYFERSGDHGRGAARRLAAHRRHRLTSTAKAIVYITGRKKELIVSSTGKKIYPARVESLFKMEPLISQVLLIGDRLPFLTALFTINTAVAETLEGHGGVEGHAGCRDGARRAPVLTEVQKAVARVNKQLAPFEQVRKYRMLERDFLHRGRRADGHHEGAAHARDGEFQRAASKSCTRARE